MVSLSSLMGSNIWVGKPYSTVTDFSPTGSVFLVINILFKSPNLWVSPYSQYQQRLFNIIRSQHEEQGKNFVEICNYLISKGYKSTRGKDLTQSIVWSIYSKKKKSIQRFGRVFDPVITDVKLDLIDYFPQEWTIWRSSLVLLTLTIVVRLQGMILEISS